MRTLSDKECDKLATLYCGEDAPWDPDMLSGAFSAACVLYGTLMDAVGYDEAADKVLEVRDALGRKLLKGDRPLVRD
jgi:hypothetical protein